MLESAHHANSLCSAGSRWRVPLGRFAGRGGFHRAVPKATIRAMTPNRTILLVEDDVDIANLVRVNLEKEGHVVTHAPDGREAIRLFDQNATRYTGYDVSPDMIGECRTLYPKHRFEVADAEHIPQRNTRLFV